MVSPLTFLPCGNLASKSFSESREEEASAPQGEGKEPCMGGITLGDDTTPLTYSLVPRLISFTRKSLGTRLPHVWVTLINFSP